MSEEILVNDSPQETRVALIEQGVLKEVFIERNTNHGLVGNIYKGVVQRVLPGMDAAFVEVGMERCAFLHATDMVRACAGSEAGPSVGDIVHAGDEVLVQVIKNPIGSKGARLTTQISIPSRYMVLLPHSGHIGISTRIENEEERERLKALVAEAREQQGSECGFIMRTAGEGVDADAIAADMKFLTRLWDSICEQVVTSPAGTLIHGDLPLVMRMLRDLLGSRVDRVRIDSHENAQRVRAFARRFVPESYEYIEFYEGERSIFDLYNVEEELQRALDRKVMLKSGGHLVFDQTEAMTTVDVNTGGYVGRRNLEETVFKTNLEAAQAAARQLRLRNLGGIIIIDFIDMEDEEHRRQVVQALEKSLEADSARTSASTLSDLGLVEMTRKRTRESLEQQLCEPCPSCSGRGMVKTVETVCFEILREIERSAHQFGPRGLLVLANADVIDAMLDEQSVGMAELEASIGTPIKLQSESLYGQEHFDVVLI